MSDAASRNASQSSAEARQVAANVGIHDRIAEQYDQEHGEIFNEIEQTRLREALRHVIGLLQTSGAASRALDYGCGSGNLTRHLVSLGLDVTAADVSPRFLDLVGRRFPTGVSTTLLPGGSAAALASSSFDLVVTYSVLHHVPDYLAAVSELARVCRVGGLIYIDHEAPESVWSPNPEYERFRRAALRVDWRKFLVLRNYLGKIRRLFQPRYSNEGDIHVWPDDHIEWSRVDAQMARAGCEVAWRSDYLVYRSLYRRAVYDAHRDTLVDMRATAYRKVR